MAKIFTPQKFTDKQNSKEESSFDDSKRGKPSESTIQSLLNFSKSLSMPTSKNIGKMFVVGN
jgi:hypothetical protein